MTNIAAEARALVQANHPGATVIERGRGWIRHQHPTDPDRKIFQTQVGPMHYGPGNDQEIDTAWQHGRHLDLEIGNMFAGDEEE